MSTSILIFLLNIQVWSELKITIRHINTRASCTLVDIRRIGGLVILCFGI